MARQKKSKVSKTIAKVDDTSRQVIVDKARPLFAEFGYAGTSTREIAKQAGLNISLISYYFGGKEGLYKAVIEEFAQQVSGQIQKMLDTFVDVEMNEKKFIQEIKEFISIILDMKEKNRDVCRIMDREKITGMPYSKEIHENIFAPIGMRMVDFISLGQKKGIVDKKIHPKVFFVSMVEAILGYLAMSQCHVKSTKDCLTLPEDRTALIEQLTLIFTKGILK